MLQLSDFALLWHPVTAMVCVCIYALVAGFLAARE